MVLKDKTDDVVVFFDFENIVYSLRHRLGENPNFELLMDKCQEYGRIVLARAYADWSLHNTVIAPLQASGFDPIYVPTYFYENKERKARKNAVDIHIAIEAIEVMYTQPHIDTYILLTGDKDFIPLANALRRNGKTVIAIGVQGTTSPYMRQATDDFVYYNELLEVSKGRKPKTPQKDIYKVLVDAVEKLQHENQKTVFPQVKHTMSEMLGSFDEKDYTDSKGVHFNRFKDFILEAQRLGHVRLVTTGSVNEVLLPGETSPEEELADKAKAETAALPSFDITSTEGAFELLVWAVNHADEEGKSPRTSSIKTIMRSVHHDFDEKQLKDEDGEFFAKFSDFTQAAARRGLVRIEGKGIRMEIYPGESLSFPKEPQPIPSIEVEDEQLSSENNLLSDDDISSLEASLPADSESSVPASSDLITPPQEPYAYVSDYRMRVLVVDALRNCEYPAPAHTIGQHCIEASEQRNVTLPNRRLNQLLTSARNMGLLKKAGEEASEAQEYTFVENTQRIKLFLEDET
jgi:uncharacterized protein (TIGR00288 family)